MPHMGCDRSDSRHSSRDCAWPCFTGYWGMQETPRAFAWSSEVDEGRFEKHVSEKKRGQ